MGVSAEKSNRGGLNYHFFTDGVKDGSAWSRSALPG